MATMRKLNLLIILHICLCTGKCENDTPNLNGTDTFSSNQTDYEDYEFPMEYEEMSANVSIYPSAVVPLVAPEDFINGTEDSEDERTTLSSVIKPAMTSQTPKPGVEVLIYGTTTPNPEEDISEDITLFQDFTEKPELIQLPPKEDTNDTIRIQLKIEEITKKLTSINDHDLHKLNQEVASDMAAVRDELDMVIKAEEAISKKLVDLHSKYISLQQEMVKLNETLKKVLHEEDIKRVIVVLSLLNQNKTNEAAEEVSKLVDVSKIHDVVYQFYSCKQENIMSLVQFTHQLRNPASTAVNKLESTRQLISLLALYSEMKMCEQESDPGILVIEDMVVSIHALEEFPVIKHDAGVLFYDEFREDVEKDARVVLTEWQNKMMKGEFQDIVEFAKKSTIYSDIVNHNMISLVWVPNSFDANMEFLRALPNWSNRVAGYVCLNDVYKNHNRSDEMIKLAVTAKRDIENNLDDFDEYDIKFIYHHFWEPIRKLIWSESCVIRNRYTGKYLFEFMEIERRNKGVYSVETVEWKEKSLERNKDFHWKFVPDEKLPGTFRIQNVLHQHYLVVGEANDTTFKYWPRRTVKTSEDQNGTALWTVILADKNSELFSFKSSSGILTGSKNSYVYAENRPSRANISPKDDEVEFLQNHLWSIECKLFEI